MMDNEIMNNEMMNKVWKIIQRIRERNQRKISDQRFAQVPVLQYKSFA
jgi:hypothetical protein